MPIAHYNFRAPLKDRGGNVYLMGLDGDVFTHILSRTRQWEKSYGFKSGRQLKKWRKQSRLNVREMIKNAKVVNG